MAQKEYQNRYQNLFNSMPLAFVVHQITLDESGLPKDCRFLSVNPAFERITGLKADQIIGRQMVEVLPDMEPNCIEVYGRVALTGKPIIFENHSRKLDKYFEIHVYRPQEGQIACIFSDITAQELDKEMMRRQQDELTAHNAVLSASIQASDFEDLLQLMLNITIEFAGVESGSLHLVEDEQLVMRRWSGFSTAFRTHILTFPTGQAPDWMREHRVMRERFDEEGSLPVFAKKEGIQLLVSFPLLAPLKGEKEWTGTLLLASREYDALSEKKLSAMRVISEHVTICISHARLLRRAEERLSRLQTLHNIDKAIARQLNLRDVLRLTLEGVPKELGADAAAISLVDIEKMLPQMIVMHLPNGTYVEEKAFDLAESLLHWFVDRQEPVIIHDLTKDPRLQPFLKHIQNGPLISYLGVPLIVREKTIGILHILTTVPHVFASEDIDFFRTLGGQVAIAIENARIFEELKNEVAERKRTEEALTRRVNELSALTRIGIIVNQSYDVKDIFKQAMGEVLKIFHINAGGIMLRNEQTGELELTASHGLDEESIKNISRIKLEDRPSRKALQTGQPVVLEKLENLPQKLQAFLRQKGIRSELAIPLIGQKLAIPLIGQKTIIGTMVLGADSPKYFDPAGIELFMSIGHQIAIAAEKARLYQTIEKNEKRYQALVERNADGIIIQDKTGKVTYTSPAIYDITGYTPDEFTGHNIIELIHPDDRSRYLKILAQLVKNPSQVTKIEVRTRHKEGSIHWCEATAKNLLDDPAINGIIVNIRDITERKRTEAKHEILEAQFRQAQKMEAIGRLAGGVAHDFNNMLSIINGYAELILMDLSPDDPLYNDLQEILLAGQRAARLTKQLLAFSRQQPAKPVAINLNSIISESQKMLKRLIGEDIDFQFKPGHDLWLTLMDPSQFDQILFNLAVNARDAMPDTGTITIETANKTADESYCKDYPGLKAGEYVLLTFSDTGTGIGKEVQEKIFEPFFTTKAEGYGTGLGLSTVYGIVKQNNGYIAVNSEPGQGTTFTIYFPRYTGSMEKSEVIPEKFSRGSKETILIVEDEKEVLKLCQYSLVPRGYNVLTASQPKEALSICEKHPGPIDLLVTDVIMPTMNGKELSERIAQLRPAIKILFMSGYTADVITRRDLLEKNVNYIQKPFDLVDFVNKVRAVLNQK